MAVSTTVGVEKLSTRVERMLDVLLRMLRQAQQKAAAATEDTTTH
jgi:hypothetical protein